MIRKAKIARPQRVFTNKYPLWKRAYITGGSSGIGLATACRLAALGIDVVLLARNKEKLAQAEKKIHQEMEKQALECKSEMEQSSIISAVMDITDQGQVKKVISELCLLYGPPDLVVNSAGVAYPHYFEQISVDHYKNTIETNLTGTWYVTQTILPYMKKGSWIVNISSVAGFVGFFGYTAYSAAKFGVIGFSESLRNELASRDIGVSVLCPPDTRTPQLEAEETTKPLETKAIAGNAPPLTAEYVAEELIRGIIKKRFFIVPSLQGKLVYYLHRFFPRLLYKILDREVKKVERQRRDK